LPVIARFSILLPFEFLRSHDVLLPPWTLERVGCQVQVLAPVQSAARTANVAPGDITPENIREFVRPSENTQPSNQIFMNGTSVVLVDLLQILFQRSGDFKRERDVFISASDDAPTFPLAIEIANEFLSRFRMLTGDFRIRNLIATRTLAVLEYLGDDGQPVAEDPSKLKGAANHYAKTPLNPLPPHVWEAIRTTTATTDRRAWDGLLLDAVGLLPEVGPALVLAATSLETLIADALDSLSATTSAVPPSLWMWINDRGDYRKEPSVLDQYDVLWKVFTGRSLRDEAELWEALRNIKDARNSFVHEGRALIGKREASLDDARGLLAKADRIVQWVEAFLPETARRPRLTQTINIAVRKSPVRPPAVMLKQSTNLQTAAGYRELIPGKDDGGGERSCQ